MEATTIARITPGSAGPITKMENLEWYPARIASVARQEEDPARVDPEGKPYPANLIVDFALSSDPDDTIRAYLGFKIGQQKGGQVARLRALCNALAGKPETTPIAWFDDATFQFGYADGTEFMVQTAQGLHLQGKTVGDRFKVTEYRAARASGGASAPAAKPVTPAAFPPAAQLPQRPPVDETDASEVPF